MLELLTTISLIAGGILFLLLLLSIIGGLDFDFDMDFDADGGLGGVKSVLTFVSAGAWVTKLVLQTYDRPVLAFTVGIAAGAIGVFLLSRLVRFMLSQEENVNFRPEDALFQKGKVYLRIPPTGDGMVNVNVNGASREFKARTQDGTELPTGTPIEVVNLEDDGRVVVRQLV